MERIDTRGEYLLDLEVERYPRHKVKVEGERVRKPKQKRRREKDTLRKKLREWN